MWCDSIHWSWIGPVLKAKKGARLLQTCDMVSAFSQGLWGRWIGRDIGKRVWERGLVTVNQKNQAVFVVDRNNLVNSILIQVITSANRPTGSCVMYKATWRAAEPIDLWSKYIHFVLGSAVGQERSLMKLLHSGHSLCPYDF